MGDTPTPLRALADPIAHQVMPSRSRASTHAHTAARNNGQIVPVMTDMPPPPPKYRTAAQIRSQTAVALPEDTYTAAVDSIITRDYFPSLPRLQQQLEWLEAMESGDTARIAETKARVAQSVQRADAVVGTPTPLAATAQELAGAHARTHTHIHTHTHTHAPHGTTAAPNTQAGSAIAGRALPGRVLLSSSDDVASVAGGRPEDDAASYVSWSADVTARTHVGVGTRTQSVGGGDAVPATAEQLAEQAAQRLGLDAYQANFTTEDNASFAKNFEQVSEERARKHWWVHAHVSANKFKYMLTDRNASRAAPMGQLEDASVEGVNLLEDTGLHPDTHGLVRTWKHRPRNALFFQPDLTTSNAVSGVANPAPNPDLRYNVRDPAAVQQALLTDTPANISGLVTDEVAGQPSSASSVVSGTTAAYPSLLRDDGGVVQPRAINRNATRLSAAEAGAGQFEDAELPASEGATGSPKVNGYGFVATPQIVPGVHVEPVMTWGTLAGTPLVLDAPSSVAPSPAMPVSDMDLVRAIKADTNIDTNAASSKFRVNAQPDRERLAEDVLSIAAAKKRSREAMSRGFTGVDSEAGATSRKIVARAATEAHRGIIAASARHVTPAFAATPTPLPAGSSSVQRPAGSVVGRTPGGAASVTGSTTSHARSTAARVAALPPAAQAIVRRIAEETVRAKASADTAAASSWTSFAGDAALRGAYSKQ